MIFGGVFIAVGIAVGLAAMVCRARWVDYDTQVAQDTWGAWKGTRRPWMLVFGGILAIAFGISAVLGGLYLL